jgi:acetolactate synthase-1/3 small subunit
MSRMTIVVDAANTEVEQVCRQLFKLVDIVKVIALPEPEAIVRELALVKVSTTIPGSRSEIIELAEIYKAQIVDVAPDNLIIEITGDERRIDDMITLLRPFGIREIVRTGRAAMSRAMSDQDVPAGPVPLRAVGHRSVG